jgi:FtsH-binding integral membrane protein
MNDNVARLLEQLASKLGTTVEYLWAVMVRQAKIEAVADVVYLTICVVVLVVGIKKLINWGKENDDYDFGVPGPITVFSIIGLLIVGVVSLALMSELITLIGNPEYWALKQILNNQN